MSERTLEEAAMDELRENMFVISAILNGRLSESLAPAGAHMGGAKKGTNLTKLSHL